MSEQMRAEFESWADSKCMSLTRIRWDSGAISDYAYTATFDAWQVWQAAYAAGRMAEQAEVERLKDENEWLGIAGQQMARHLAEAKAELAAAKAASVCPVKWKSAERFFKSGADLGNQWSIEFWFDTKEQRDKFGKWMKERNEQ